MLPFVPCVEHLAPGGATPLQGNYELGKFVRIECNKRRKWGKVRRRKMLAKFSGLKQETCGVKMAGDGGLWRDRFSSPVSKVYFAVKPLKISAGGVDKRGREEQVFADARKIFYGPYGPLFFFSFSLSLLFLFFLPYIVDYHVRL